MTRPQHFRELSSDAQSAAAIESARRTVGRHSEYVAGVMATELLGACVSRPEKLASEAYDYTAFHTEGDFAHVEGRVPKWGEDRG
ncbi:MAG: hypothetical protein QG629_161 [Patescibacteria group bacterium]|nr:hypothetical protein [Candidatus Saccharibacteria bacterium]MDQ5963079.1 hypothetical protein [Patescibacteria group bacterium]